MATQRQKITNSKQPPEASKKPYYRKAGEKKTSHSVSRLFLFVVAFIFPFKRIHYAWTITFLIAAIICAIIAASSRYHDTGASSWAFGDDGTHVYDWFFDLSQRHSRTTSQAGIYVELYAGHVG